MSGARKPKALNASQLAALEVLVEHSDGWRRQGRTEQQRETYAALYWHTLKPSYCWPGCGWQFSPATLRSLVGRGLAESKPGLEGAYWTRATTAGRSALAAATPRPTASKGTQSKSATEQAAEASDKINRSGTITEKSDAT